MEDSEKNESESGDESEEPPVKIRKIERNRRSTKKVYDSDDQSDDDIKNDSKKSSRRSSARPSRKNSPEVSEEPSRSRRSVNKRSLPAEETASERRASKRSLDSFNTISLSMLIDEIIKHKNAWPFTKPVSTSEVPDYLEVIKVPMDFSKIKSKLNLGDYSTNEQAMKDVELVFYNCDLYNIADSEIYK